MKKLIFAAFAAGAMVLAGCTKVEVKEVPDSRAIRFDNFVSNSVKAIDVTSDLTKFYVYGGYADNWDVFSGDEVYYSGSVWTYDDLRYWKDETTTYNFAAYSNDNKAVSGATVALDDANHKHLVITNYSISDNGDNDLVYAYAEGENQQSSANVDFTFYHILSKVVFDVTADASLNGITLTFSDITLKKVNTKGTFTGSDPVGNQFGATCWVGDANTKTDISSFVAGEGYTDLVITGDSDDDAFRTAPKFMIPQIVPTDDGSKFELSFSISVSGEKAGEYNINTSTPYNFSIELPAPTGNAWDPGYSYIYTAKFNIFNFNDELEPITFSVTTVDSWETPDINTDLGSTDIGTGVTE